MPRVAFLILSGIFFLIFAQNIDFGYTLELPQLEPTIYVLKRKQKDNVYPCTSHFYYKKVWCNGVRATLHGHDSMMTNLQ